MMAAVREALEAGDNLMAEAPTGSGKTAACLHPALAHGLAAGRQVFFLTSKTLQQTMAVAALRAMNPDGAFRTLQIRAKEKMCANGRVLCHEDFCPYARDYPAKDGAVENPGAATPGPFPFRPRHCFCGGEEGEVCPFEVQLELAGGADAIVADYNYVFEPGVALRGLEPEDEPVLLVDEAHNLPNRARQIFSPELLEESFRAAQDSLLLQSGELFDSLSGTISRLIALLAETAAAADPVPLRKLIRQPNRCARCGRIGSRTSCVTWPGSTRPGWRRRTIRLLTFISSGGALSPC